MANNLLPTPVGIDYPIQLLQTYLYDRLYHTWGGDEGLTSAMFQMYGRAYRNKSDDGYIPQWYEALKNYSQALFHNDNIAVQMYFGLSDAANVDINRYEYTINLYCFCNVALLYPDDVDQRQDERIIDDVAQLLTNGTPYGFFVKGVYRDVDNVLAKFSGVQKNKSLITNNLQDKLCFRIEMYNAIDINAFTTCTAPFATPLYFNSMTVALEAQIVESPNTALKQKLFNGQLVQLQYPTGGTLTIPFLIGKDVFPYVFIDGNAYCTYEGSLNYIAFDKTTGTFSGVDFISRSIVSIQCNVNN